MASNTSGSPAAAKSSPTSNVKPNRLPAPTLFVGPPSRNASQLSLSRTATADSSIKPTRDPLIRQKSALSRPYNPVTGKAPPAEGDGSKDSPAGAVPTLKKASERGVEARWKEMQSLLNEVELTAQSSTHVFGESHAAALDELRRAQVELARAWGRGGNHDDDGHLRNGSGGPAAATPDLEAHVSRFKTAEELTLDRPNIKNDNNNNINDSSNDAAARRRRAGTDASASTALSDESGASERRDSIRGGGRSQLEDETEQDIRRASERRAANEAYFKKVDGSVRDVVAKLEVVAETMRGVEGESRSLWSADSSTSGSIITAGGGGGGGGSPEVKVTSAG